MQSPPYSEQGAPRFGRTNPERIENRLWETIVRHNWTAYQARKELETRSGQKIETPAPFWSWERFGRTSTTLPDSRIVHIAGEHEDHYDPDFCIYNDVTVEHPDGRLEFFIYPRDVFPPTDFHTATLAGDRIVLIGSLGYKQDRRPQQTQVLLLDTTTFAISPAPASATSGACPGWLSRHDTERLDDTTLLVTGGNLQNSDGYRPNLAQWKLDLATWTWTPVSPGDLSIFPVAREDYIALRNPRAGTANPERVDNAFWIEMARRQWTPRRARLHYADMAETPPDNAAPNRAKPPPPREQVVWSARREQASTITLDDGRTIAIGGKVGQYGQDRADAWDYRDIIVTAPDGTIEIFAYPDDVLPPLLVSRIVATPDKLLIFGLALGQGMKPPLVVRVMTLNVQTMRIETAAQNQPPARPNVYEPPDVSNPGLLLFAAIRRQEGDPVAHVAFDLATMQWLDHTL